MRGVFGIWGPEGLWPWVLLQWVLGGLGTLWVWELESSWPRGSLGLELFDLLGSCAGGVNLGPLCCLRRLGGFGNLLGGFGGLGLELLDLEAGVFGLGCLGFLVLGSSCSGSLGALGLGSFYIGALGILGVVDLRDSLGGSRSHLGLLSLEGWVLGPLGLGTSCLGPWGSLGLLEVLEVWVFGLSSSGSLEGFGPGAGGLCCLRGLGLQGIRCL